MPDLTLEGPEFHDFACQILGSGRRLRFVATGESMQPFILKHDVLEVAPLAGIKVDCGDVLLVETNDSRLFAHRLVKTSHGGGISNYLIQADNSTAPDGWFRAENILGRVEIVERGNRQIILTSFPQKLRARVWVAVAPWVVKYSWLPVGFRRLLRDYLLVH